jgi:hypothetical protein
MAAQSGAKETDPLLPTPGPTPRGSSGYSTPRGKRDWLDYCAFAAVSRDQGKEFDELKIDVHGQDEMTYQPASLLRWSALLFPEGSIWRSSQLWHTMLKVFVLAMCVAAIVVLCVPDPVSLRIHHFLKISYFLNFFVGLCVSFFMTSSLNRWHECTEGFLELGDAIRNLQMQFQALGAPEERMDLCTRYGLLSGYFLKHELAQETMDPGELDGAKEVMWKAFALPAGKEVQGYEPHVDEGELEVLREVSDPAGVMWTWVSSLVARMAEDGEIPGMATPTYGRIMNLAQDAHDGIRHVRSSISVRAPFVYVHMLASLVHVNNILNAISLGLVFGTAISGLLIHKDIHYFEPKVRGNQVERDSSFALVTILICTLGPLFYQAITEISIAISNPFTCQFGRIPVDRILSSLQEDLADGKTMTSKLPHWERPRFKRA